MPRALAARRAGGGDLGGVTTLGERGGALTLVSLADIDGCACAAASKNVTSVLGGSENPGRCPWRGTSGLASRVGRLGAGGGGVGRSRARGEKSCVVTPPVILSVAHAAHVDGHIFSPLWTHRHR